MNKENRLLSITEKLIGELITITDRLGYPLARNEKVTSVIPGDNNKEVYIIFNCPDPNNESSVRFTLGRGMKITRPQL